uniref:ATP synthase F0 subunit 8 n=1 Tax=Madrepora oculata TaxID=213639 RepID=I6XMW7_9CNID|nr:ATP synthase F0 subunit 8 [Madrepora oculata]AFN40610.1 ATP synthase F0 subunit 8 [Madrepora oculata]
MPQLNTITFLNQYGYTFFLFFSFLFLFVFILLPQIKKTLFFRKKINQRDFLKEGAFKKEAVFIWL